MQLNRNQILKIKLLKFLTKFYKWLVNNKLNIDLPGTFLSVYLLVFPVIGMYLTPSSPAKPFARGGNLNDLHGCATHSIGFYAALSQNLHLK